MTGQSRKTPLPVPAAFKPAAPQSTKRKHAAPPNKKYLAAAIGVVVLGTIVVLWRGGQAPDIQAAPASTGPISPASETVRAMPQALSTPPAAGPVRLRNAIWYARQDAAGKLRPSDFLQKMAESWSLPQFIPPGSVQLKDGQPAVVYVLLRAQLDAYTEELWKRAGLLDEGVPAHPALRMNPFFRKVTLKDGEALGYLFDWHVESAALTLPAPRSER